MKTMLANIPPWLLLYRRRWLAAVLLLILFAGAGAGIWFVHLFSVGPEPPSVPSNPHEPELSALLESMRARVIKEPRSASAWGALGQAFFVNELEDESQVCFAEAERLDSHNPRWPHYQAVLLLTRGQQQAALLYLRRSAERAATVVPENLIPRLLLAETLLSLGQGEEAEDLFRQVLARHPNEVRAHLGMALAASARQDWQTSRTHLLRCLNSPSARKKASEQLETVCQHLGQQDEAENYRRQAESLPPDDKWDDPFVQECESLAASKNRLYRRAASLEAAGRLRESAKALQALAEKYPEDYRPRLSLGKLLGRMGDLQNATLLLRDACLLAPDNVQAHFYLSMTLFSQAERARQQQGDAKKAEKLYQDAAESARRALAVKPDYGSAFLSLGSSLRQLGQRAEALNAFRQAVHCNPEHAEAHFFLGRTLAEEGDQDEARKQLEQAMTLAAPNSSLHQDAAARLAALQSPAKKAEPRP